MIKIPKNNVNFCEEVHILLNPFLNFGTFLDSRFILL